MKNSKVVFLRADLGGNTSVGEDRTPRRPIWYGGGRAPMYARHRYLVHHESIAAVVLVGWLRRFRGMHPRFILLPASVSLYKQQVHSEAATHCISDISVAERLNRKSSMTSSIPKLLLLLFFLSHRSPIARAGDDGSYKVLSMGSPRTDSVCSQSKGVVLSVRARLINYSVRSCNDIWQPFPLL
jgi:hypothetical protein